jgi:hypothetical protein
MRWSRDFPDIFINSTLNISGITSPNLGHKFYPLSQWTSHYGQYSNTSWQIFIRGSNLIMGF